MKLSLIQPDKFESFSVGLYTERACKHCHKTSIKYRDPCGGRITYQEHTCQTCKELSNVGRDGPL